MTGSGVAGGLLMVLLGSLVIAQATAGGALTRLGVLPS